MMMPQEDKGRRFIGHEFCSKPMANPVFILNRSDKTKGTKIATVAAELKRIWKNTWEGASTQKYDLERIHPQESNGRVHEGPERGDNKKLVG